MTDSNHDDNHSKKKTVGYKSPPSYSKFKKGKSGNPKGRPKKQNPLPSIGNSDELLAKALSESVTLKVNGKTKKIQKCELVHTQLVNKAIAGDMAAIKWVMEHYHSLPSHYKEPEGTIIRITEEDEKMVARFLEMADEYIREEQTDAEDAKDVDKKPDKSDDPSSSSDDDV